MASNRFAHIKLPPRVVATRSVRVSPQESLRKLSRVLESKSNPDDTPQNNGDDFGKTNPLLDIKSSEEEHENIDDNDNILEDDPLLPTYDSGVDEQDSNSGEGEHSDSGEVPDDKREIQFLKGRMDELERIVRRDPVSSTPHAKPDLSYIYLAFKCLKETKRERAEIKVITDYVRTYRSDFRQPSLSSALSSNSGEKGKKLFVQVRHGKWRLRKHAKCPPKRR